MSALPAADPATLQELLVRAARAALAIAATAAVYLAAVRLQRRYRNVLLNPVLLSIVALILALEAAGIGYRPYDDGGRLISFFLGPAVVALGVPLHHQAHEIARRGVAILGSILLGSLVGILSGTGVAALLGAPPEIVRTLAARSVTTPIAIAIVARAGGLPSLAADIAIATGVLGGVLGPVLLRRIGTRNPSAFGLAMGAAAHGIGTARAAQEGPLEGASAGLAIGLMGVATAVLAPIVLALLRWLGVA